MRALTALAVAALTVSGSTAAVANDDPVMSIPATPYMLDVEFSGLGDSADLIEPAYLSIYPDGRFSGSNGCNKISGVMHIDGDQLTTSDVLSTLRLCDGTAAAVENAMMKALADGTTVVIEPHDFVILNAGSDNALYLFH